MIYEVIRQYSIAWAKIWLDIVIFYIIRVRNEIDKIVSSPTLIYDFLDGGKQKMRSYENVNYFTCYMPVSIRFYGTNFIAIWKLDFIVEHNKSQPCYHKRYFVVANRTRSKSLNLLRFLISYQRTSGCYLSLQYIP